MCKFHKQFKKLPPHIQMHCLKKIRQLKEGVSIREIGAKYLARCKGAERLLSVRLSKGYRLIIKMGENGFIHEWVGSHQKYDKWISE